MQLLLEERTIGQWERESKLSWKKNCPEESRCREDQTEFLQKHWSTPWFPAIISHNTKVITFVMYFVLDPDKLSVCVSGNETVKSMRQFCYVLFILSLVRVRRPCRGLEKFFPPVLQRCYGCSFHAQEIVHTGHGMLGYNCFFLFFFFWRERCLPKVSWKSNPAAPGLANQVWPFKSALCVPGKTLMVGWGLLAHASEAIWDGVSRDGPVSVLFSWRDYTIELEKPIRRVFFFFFKVWWA